MKNIFNTLLFALSISVLFSSCASLAGFQDAKTIGENNGEVVASLNFSQSPDFIGLRDSSGASSIPFLVFPNIELGGRYGVLENLDVTLKMNTNLNLAIGAKYQFLGDQNSVFNMATGLDFGSFGLFSGLWNVQVPLYMSVHPKENLSIYLAPRYIYQFSSYGNLIHWNYVGGNFGLLFGKKNKFGLDVGLYGVGTKYTQRHPLFTFGVGGKFVISGNKNKDY